MGERKRTHITMNNDLFEKLTAMAEQYGITTNAFMVFILGQWVETNYEQQKLMVDKVNEMFSSQKDILENPTMLKMVKEILDDDKEFKQNVAKKL